MTMMISLLSVTIVATVTAARKSVMSVGRCNPDFRPLIKET